ncbi:ATP-binding protein, partial [Lactobacillus sp. XV13L]|nr:ATP-binding protein [Lactobacillus sp. XV13L]
MIQHKLSLKLKKHISNFNSEITGLDLETNNLCVDPTRMVVQDTLEVSNIDKDGILLRDMGSGEENIIKTSLAMSSKNSTLILLEEPENHLSFDLARKQVIKIKGAEYNKRQVIVSTHSPLLASKLNINNLKWLNNDGKFVSFKDVSEDTAEFFLKADNIDILQVILAKKVVLV